MPIKPENKGRYPKDWPLISKRIRERAGNQCEVCGIANGLQGWRVADGTFYTVEQFAESHINPKHEDELCRKADRHPVTIVLTVAHLNHTPEDCAEDNLKAMCQCCHNRYDAPHRLANARRTRALKKSLPLFV